MTAVRTALAARIGRVLRRGPRYVARRVLDSAKRRSRRPWAYVYRRVLTERALVAALGARDVDSLWNELADGPFFVRSSEASVAAKFRIAFPSEAVDLVRLADAVLRHEFDLLGSGPRPLGTPLPWHSDFKTGRRWPLAYCTDIEYNELDRPTDVKVPWELSRCQHFTRLGQAYWLTNDERFAAEFVAETTDWIQSNPLSLGVNWACAMDVALRAVSWIWGFHFFAQSPSCRSTAFRSAFLRALYAHGEFIVKHLEKADLNGNHYLCDGVGLVFLGCFFRRSRSAQRWLQIGRSIVADEIFQQTTPDGVDFEQSTAYHRLVLEGFLTSYELLRLHGAPPSDACWDRLQRMIDFVAAYTKPDGRAPLIGDADDGRIQILGTQRVGDHRYLLAYGAVRFGRSDWAAIAERCWDETFWLLGAAAPDRFRSLPVSSAPPRSAAFDAGGFYILRGAASHAIVDCGDVGMRGRGGHGHNDILSFELFLNGMNVVTDCGAFLYTASREWRNRFRSTAFHNTVQVDGEELNRFLEPDALWQLQYDAKPVDPRLHSSARVDYFRGGHSGYTRLPSAVLHTRAVFADRRLPRVLVEDKLDGSGRHQLVWRFHLDPGVAAVVDGRDVRLSSGEREVWLMPNLDGPRVAPALEAGWVSPSYGVKRATQVAVWRWDGLLPVAASFLFGNDRLTAAERGHYAAELVAAAGTELM